MLPSNQAVPRLPAGNLTGLRWETLPIMCHSATQGESPMAGNNPTDGTELCQSGCFCPLEMPLRTCGNNFSLQQPACPLLITSGELQAFFQLALILPAPEAGLAKAGRPASTDPIESCQRNSRLEKPVASGPGQPPPGGHPPFGAIRFRPCILAGGLLDLRRSHRPAARSPCGSSWPHQRAGLACCRSFSTGIHAHKISRRTHFAEKANL